MTTPLLTTELGRDRERLSGQQTMSANSHCLIDLHSDQYSKDGNDTHSPIGHQYGKRAMRLIP